MDFNNKEYDEVFISTRFRGPKRDGVTDDTFAIQAIINTNGGKEIWFPPGDYRISNKFTTQGNLGTLSHALQIREPGTKLRGVRGRTRFLFDSLQHNAVLIGNDLHDPDIGVAPHDCGIEGITFEDDINTTVVANDYLGSCMIVRGDNFHCIDNQFIRIGLGINGYGESAGALGGLVVERCRFDRFARTAIRPSWDCRVINNRFTGLTKVVQPGSGDVAHGIYPGDQVHSVTAMGNNFDNLTGYAFHVFSNLGTNMGNYTFSINTIRAHVLGVFIEAVGNDEKGVSSICGNTFLGDPNVFVDVDINLGSGDATNCTGNTHYIPPGVGNTTAYNLRSTSGGDRNRGVNISNNTIRNSRFAFYLAQIANGAISGFSIQNNFIMDCHHLAKCWWRGVSGTTEAIYNGILEDNYIQNGPDREMINFFVDAVNNGVEIPMDTAAEVGRNLHMNIASQRFEEYNDETFTD